MQHEVDKVLTIITYYKKKKRFITNTTQNAITIKRINDNTTDDRRHYVTNLTFEINSNFVEFNHVHDLPNGTQKKRILPIPHTNCNEH